MQDIGVNDRRRRSVARARLSFNPTLGRPGGRVSRQARRCLIAKNGVATMTQLKTWCYAGRAHRHWQYEVIREALHRLGARQIGRAGGIGRPGIWAFGSKSGSKSE
jgi:hypothetical protein